MDEESKDWGRGWNRIHTYQQWEKMKPTGSSGRMVIAKAHVLLII